MNTIADLINYIRTGAQPVVTFKKAVEDKESYAEPGMRARVVRAEPVGDDDVVRIRFDYEPFAAHNALLESANYFDKEGRAVLTARQAGYYAPQEDVYFDLSEALADLLEVESDAAIEIFRRFLAAPEGRSYVQWLESRLQALEAGAARG